jgi:hypothetical protein
MQRNKNELNVNICDAPSSFSHFFFFTYSKFHHWSQFLKHLSHFDATRHSWLRSPNARRVAGILQLPIRCNSISVCNFICLVIFLFKFSHREVENDKSKEYVFKDKERNSLWVKVSTNVAWLLSRQHPAKITVWFASLIKTNRATTVLRQYINFPTGYGCIIIDTAALGTL